MLRPEDEKYFDDLEDMFGTQGWRNLVDEAKRQIYEFQAQALEAKNWDDVCYLKGQAEQLARLINLRDVTATLRANAEQAGEE